MLRMKPTVEMNSAKKFERAIQKASLRSYQVELDKKEESTFDFGELVGVVPDLLALLTKQERYIVQLVFWEGLNLSEVSFSTRMRLPTVKRLYASAIKKMKSAMTEIKEEQH